VFSIGATRPHRERKTTLATINDFSDDALGSMPTTTTSAYANRSLILTAFDRFASRVTRWAGSPVAFALALASVALWAALGHIFHYSENWQLVINTGTTIVTFLMVFMIQQSQNKDSIALHLKLNELLAASKQASNRMIGIEDLDEQDLRQVAEFYVRLAARAKDGGKGKETHSIDEEGMPTDTRTEGAAQTPST
jgi:low affinity Fe/Cu permease